MTEVQIARIMVRESFSTFLWALRHLAVVSAYAAWRPVGRHLEFLHAAWRGARRAGHTPTAICLSAAFGLLAGLNLGLGGIALAATIN